MKYLLILLTYLSLTTQRTNVVFAEDWQKTSLPLDGITSIEKTHKGLYVGEHDTRTWLNPYRGIYVSTDLGKTWDKAGLQDRGVVAISYDKENRRLYAATYYSVFDPTIGESVGGLFVLENGVWKHIGPKVSTASVLALRDVVLLGTNAHGLWVSFDKGANWVQKIGSGYFGPKFRVIKQSGTKIFAHDEFNVYFSTDNANSFTTIPALKDEKIADIEGSGQIVIAGTSNNRGAFISKDNGQTWSKVAQFEGKIVGKVTYFPISGAFYAYVKDSIVTDIYKSNDCVTWERTFLNLPNITSIEWVFSSPTVILASAANMGLYTTHYEASPLSVDPIFSPPWDVLQTKEVTDSISTFFDHAYPFLGYGFYSEDAHDSTTTTNYLGLNLPEPLMYYSSHDGIDFALPFGTQIKAVADGVAQYNYQAQGLGHYITITHNTGYQTVYGHLQESPAEDFATPVPVTTSQVIGKVGMSGRTTGPHLHFTVLQDKNGDQDFENDIPEGKTDPFGWQSSGKTDPWEIFQWTDTKGTHQGNLSKYLWNIPAEIYTSYTGENPIKTMDTDLTLDFSNISNEFITTVIQRVPTKAISKALPNMEAIPSLAFSISLYNNFGEKVTYLAEPAKLIYNFTQDSLKNHVNDTLEVYHLNTLTKSWEALQTLVDSTKSTIIANAQNFSTFAVFAQKIDKLPPQTSATVDGIQINGKYIGEISVTLQSSDIDYQSTVANTFIKVNDGDWEEYVSPLSLSQIGQYTVKYKSIDIHGNLEDEKTTELEITNYETTNKLKVKNANFLIDFANGT